MRCLRLAGTLAILGLVSGCTENIAPGNDREAALDAPEPPARVAGAGAALAGVSTGLIKPEPMTQADLGSLPAIDGACRFRMTKVGFPTLVYGSSAVIKLNGRLVPLSAVGASRYASDGVEVSVRPLEPADDDGGRFEAEFVLRLPGVPDELGFHGYSQCDP